MSEKTAALPRIKICGLTRGEDALLAASLGAWAIGFVFHSQSPRAISPENAGKLIKQIVKSGVKPSLRTVGVCVNLSFEMLQDILRLSQVNTLQLHGDESPEFCSEIRELIGSKIKDFQLFKALRLRKREDLNLISQYQSSCDALLLDTFVAGSSEWGGTGVVGNWEWAKQASDQTPIILAGGLNPENIAKAIQLVGPFAVDASSGLERIPGEKSHEKMREFFRRACEK